MEIGYHASERGAAAGDSAGLARGLSVTVDGVDVTGEGMGIGAPALRDGFTYFPSSCRTEKTGPGRFVKRFVIDKRLIVSVFGRPSLFLTSLVERSTDWYAAHPSSQQALLGLSRLARRLFRINIRYRNAGPEAEAIVTYVIRGDEVDVSGSIRVLGRRRRLPTVILMNEVDARFFDAGLRGGRLVPPPTGWRRLPPSERTAALVNRTSRLAFSARRLRVVPRVEPKRFWGSERSEGLCWAGMDYEIDAGALHAREIGFSYRVGFTPFDTTAAGEARHEA